MMENYGAGRRGHAGTKSYLNLQETLAREGKATIVTHIADQPYLPNNPDHEVSAETVDYFVLRAS